MSANAAHVEALLRTASEKPVTDEVLTPVYTHLMAVPADSADGRLHWFCGRATPLTLAAATFLIRLHAYTEGDAVKTWKSKLKSCLAKCAECVQGLEEAKVSSRTTYFDNFNDEQVEGFYDSFDDWERRAALDDLASVGISLGAERSFAQRKMSEVPAVIYHILSNLAILKDPTILSILHAFPPLEPLRDWPSDPIPPGLMILMMDETLDVRQWAKAQAAKCKVVPIALDKFSRSHDKALVAIASALSSSSSETPAMSTPNDVTTGYAFASQAEDLWSGFTSVIRLIPPSALTSSPRRNADIRRIVTGHLHDDGPQFTNILDCLLCLLKRMRQTFWQGEGPEYPQIVFDAVKDNKSFSKLVESIDSTSTTSPWHLAWFPEYLNTIRDSPMYGEVLAKMADFLCGELQHERFGDSRTLVMVAATRMLSSVIRKSEADETSRHHLAISSVLDIHAEILVGVAFARAYNDPKWTEARNAIREMLKTVLLKDIKDIPTAIYRICGFFAGKHAEVPQLAIRKQIWKKIYDTLQSNDADGLAMIISVVAHSAHLDALHLKMFDKDPFAALLSQSGPAATKAKAALVEINPSLALIRDGFLDVVTRYTNYNISTSVLDVLSRPGVAKDIVALMLSPVENIQNAAQALIGLAFDVDVRLDCFRVLLTNLPDAALEGIQEFIDTFISFAPLVPEACNLSKSLVRCLTDIIEVLCASHNGLLQNTSFLRPQDANGPASKLSGLWNSMAAAIAIIFRRTPRWSTYFEKEEMLEWMRDALIFGRDMLAQRRVIESAAVSLANQGGKAKAAHVRKKMVNDMQPVLSELARWLRLTDEEVLHQSFSLLLSLLDCFKECQIAPSEDGVSKLTKLINNARTAESPIEKTRLDSTKLSILEDALTPFQKDEDIEVVSYTPAPRRREELVPSKPKTETSKTKPRASLPSTNRHASTSKAIPRISSSMASVQAQLDAANSVLPTFRKTGNASTTGPSKVMAHPQKRDSKGPKNEGSITSAPVEESSTSDEDSDEEGESQASGLAVLAKFQKSPKIKKPAERRKTQLLDIPTTGISAMQERLNHREDARRTKERLKPDISGLHRTLLSWNYEHNDPEPPTTGGKPQRFRIPDKFSNYREYHRILEPLLLLECWAQILQSKEETREICKCTVMQTQYAGEWLDITVTFPSVPSNWYLADTDVVLLRHESDSKKSILAKVENYRTGKVIEATLRSSSPNGIKDKNLAGGVSWNLSKVFSLSTLHREYAALAALPYYDFVDTILQPQLTKIPNTDFQDVKRIMSTHGLNEPQAIAISNSLRTEGFVLIQGPPGTGKTKTICGLVLTSLPMRRDAPVAIHPGRSAPPAEKRPCKKILICAPSNAAIDEVASRIKQEFRGSQKQFKVVRVGAEKSVNTSVKDISLDNLVEEKLNGHLPPKDTTNEIAALRNELNTVRTQRQKTYEELSALHDNATRSAKLLDDISRLNARRMALTQQFDRLKDKQKSESRNLDATRRKFRVEVLSEADVICSTLSGAGHDILSQFEFEMVIIDEAAQAIELSSLIPLKYQCTRCIMVGDPQQLPPTVISQEASQYQYNQSLFVRLQKNRPDAVHLLSIQYRMHPDISQLPSRIFYQGRLQDGPEMDLKTKRPWHSHPKFGTYRFFNVSRGIEDQVNRSVRNNAECQVAVALYSRLRQEFSAFDFDCKVGVVTMYRAQITALQNAFEQRFGRDIREKVDFNTVDGFQGQEKDIIILSCVRAGPGLERVGFVADTRRMNVAVTRAKSSLFILGNSATLERSDNTWKEIILDARSRAFMTDIDSSYFTTASNAPQPSLPPSSKISKPLSSHPVPTDLATPSELKALVNRVPSMSAASALDTRKETPTLTPAKHISSNTNAEKRNNLKRRADDEDPPRRQPPAPVPSGDDHKSQKPRIPSIKRPKAGPSLFIPKPNKNKRPAPEENSAGPSNHRRRP